MTPPDDVANGSTFALLYSFPRLYCFYDQDDC